MAIDRNLNTVLLLGMSRSGSKLVKNALNRVPDFYCAGEILWKSEFNGSHIKKYVDGSRDFCKDTAIKEFDELSPLFLAYFYNQGVNGIGMFADKLSAIRDRSKIVLKYPYSLREALRSNLQCYKIVLLIRDPRSVLKSDFLYKTTLLQSRYRIFLEFSLSIYHLLQYRRYLRLVKRYRCKVLFYDELMSSENNFKIELSKAFEIRESTWIKYPVKKNSSSEFDKKGYDDFKPSLVSRLIIRISHSYFVKLKNY
jgi:hypothetical protein